MLRYTNGPPPVWWGGPTPFWPDIMTRYRDPVRSVTAISLLPPGSRCLNTCESNVVVVVIRRLCTIWSTVHPLFFLFSI
jgi:hypothetical protein